MICYIFKGKDVLWLGKYGSNLKQKEEDDFID